jgi:hypothetical protein
VHSLSGQVYIGYPIFAIRATCEFEDGSKDFRGKVGCWHERVSLAIRVGSLVNVDDAVYVFCCDAPKMRHTSANPTAASCHRQWLCSRSMPYWGIKPTLAAWGLARLGNASSRRAPGRHAMAGGKARFVRHSTTRVYIRTCCATDDISMISNLIQSPSAVSESGQRPLLTM